MMLVVQDRGVISEERFNEITRKGFPSVGEAAAFLFSFIFFYNHVF